MAMADLDLDAHGSGQRGDADPVEPTDAERARCEFRVGADCDTVAVGVNAKDIKRLSLIHI